MIYNKDQIKKNYRKNWQKYFVCMVQKRKKKNEQTRERRRVIFKILAYKILERNCSIRDAE